ncbi:TPA: hypothetical protein DCX16_06020 [bacterium]|nr:hypothetical protein [bacterium]
MEKGIFILGIILITPFALILLFWIFMAWLWAVIQILDALIYLEESLIDFLQEKIEERQQKERIKNKPTVEEILTLSENDIIEVDYYYSVTISDWAKKPWKKKCPKEEADGILTKENHEYIPFDDITKILKRGVKK